MKKSTTTLLKGILLAGPLFFINPLVAQNLVGYWQNWGGNEYVALQDVDPRYSIINLAFAVPGSGTDYDMTFVPCCGETVATFSAKIAALQTAGAKVNLSIGGGGTPIVLNNTTERDVFISSMNTLIDQFGVDGIDIDLEDASLTVSASSTIANPTDANILNMIEAINQIGDHYFTMHGKKMFLSFAPETANVQGGQSAWGASWGAYLPVLDALRPDIDLIHVQLYNTGSMYGLDMKEYFSGTADFIVSQIENVIQGYNVPLATNAAGHFYGFPEEKLAVGLPACPSAAGSGFTVVDTVKAAIEYLMGNGPKPGKYTLLYGPYPNLGGMMTWSINWDATASCNASSYEFASNYESIFLTGPCAQPNLGPDVNVCDISFPYNLQSNTTATPSTYYTWINLTTNQVLVSNSNSASTFDVNDPGMYKVILEDGSCTKSDIMVIENGIPAPVVEGPTTLCGTYPITLICQNAGSFPGSVGWQWYKNYQAITGETGASISSVEEDGTYTLEASLGTCLESDDHVVDSDLPTAVDDCVGPGESATLAIQNYGPGTYAWYDQASGGNQLGTGTSFTTPTLNSTTSYYVAEQGSIGTVYTGPALTANGLGTLQNWRNPDELYFDVSQAFTVKEITFYPLIWGYTHPFSFVFKDAMGNTLPNGAQSFSITHPGPSGNLIGPVTLVLNGGGVTIPVGAGYKLIITSTVGDDHWASTNFPVAYSPFLTFTGSNVAGTCLAAHNWLIESNAGCAYRVPVTATVDPVCSAALAVDLEDFNAQEYGEEQILLDWILGVSETFSIDIQRKAENEPAFYSIATLAGPPGYGRFFDKNIEKGRLYYYRLRIEEASGGQWYSPIRQAAIKGLEGYILYPNPTHDRLYLDRETTGLVMVKLLQSNGQLVQSFTSVERNIQIDVADLLPATYIIQIVNEFGQIKNFSVIKF